MDCLLPRVTAHSNRFLKLEGEPVMVNVPCKADMLGDKLTAFAPNTTGIPFFKGDKDCSMEIIKQLFDITSLFNVTTDLRVVTETFQKFAAVELQYLNLDPANINQVLDDIFQTSLCICLRGQVEPDTFKLLQTGTKRIQSFIHSEIILSEKMRKSVYFQDGTFWLTQKAMVELFGADVPAVRSI